jgi:GNAT superfamily N-acetyltransferase
VDNRTVNINQQLLIRPILSSEWADAKQLIYESARELMEPHMALADFIAMWEGWGVLSDLDDIQHNYFIKNGVFLVAELGGRLIGTGALHQFTDGAVFSPGGRLRTTDERLISGSGVCEVRRIMLRPERRGQKIGYAMMRELIRRAGELGYTKMILWTDPLKLHRAVDFYYQLGFRDLPIEGADPDELWLGMEIG